jgi:hypothetical protein
LTGAILARSGGFDMAFGLFNFHIGNNGAAELVSISESTPLAVDPSTPSAAGENTPTTTPPTPLEEEPRLETSTHQLGRTIFKIHHDPQPPHTASSATPITLWAPETSRPTRSSAAKTLTGALMRGE